MTKINEAFILCGGKGERLRPLTDNSPKPMVEVNGKPILLQLIEHLQSYGIKKIVLATGYKEEKIMQFFGNGKKCGLEISYSHEETPLGTGGALKKASTLLGKKFIMLNGDNILDIDFAAMQKLHEKNNAHATIALVETKDVTHYGVARLDGEKITEFVEKPSIEKAPSHWINCGAYILEKQAIKLLPPGFCMIEKTLFPQLASRGKLFAYKHSGQWFPTDTLEKLEYARKQFAP